MDNNFRDFRLKLIFLALCILILLAIKGHIKLGFVPELEKKNISVAFNYYGAFEKEVEVLVSSLEEAYMDVRGIKDINSVSEAGKGYILCQFSDRTSLDEAYVQLSDITAHVYADFPEGVNRPVITRSSSDLYPVFISWFPLEKEGIADRIREAYEAIPGTGKVELGGQKKKELMVNLHTDRLAGMALSSDGLDSRLRSSNLAGKVAMPGGQTLVLSSRLSSPQEFGNVYLAPDLRLYDVADLNFEEAENQSLGHIDGKPALLFFVMKSGEGNTVRLCRQLVTVTSRLGGRTLYNFGNKIEKSFIISSSILLLLFFILILWLWVKTKNFNTVSQAICCLIIVFLFALGTVTLAGYQVDITVMISLSLVIILSFNSFIPQGQSYIPREYAEPISRQDIAILRSIGRKSINDFTGEEIEKTEKWAYKFWQQLGIKSPFYRRILGDWREFDKSRVGIISGIKTIDVKDRKEAVKYIKDGLKNDVFFRGDKKTNIDTGFRIIISKQVYEDTLTYANRDYSRKKDFEKYLARLSILPNMIDIVKKSILLDTTVIAETDNQDRSFMHHFYNIANINGKGYVVSLLVDELNSEKGDIYRAYNVNDIKITPATGPKVYKPSHATGVGGSNPSSLTVADLYALVKQYDKDFKPMPFHARIKGTALTSFIVFSTLIVALYIPVSFRNLFLPFCITLASGLCAAVICQFFVRQNPISKLCIPLWCYSPILLFALFFFMFSPQSPVASGLTFSLEYESGTSFPFIQQSALDIEDTLLRWNAFDRLTLHADQGRAAFTILGGKKQDILQKIHNLSTIYPEIFFYIPEKHTRNAIDVTVYGNDVTEIENNILQLAKYVKVSANNVNIIYNFKSDVANIVLEIPVKCASAGFYPYDVYKTLYYTVSEPVVDKFFASEVETDVKIRGDARYRETLSGLLEVPILSPFGQAGEAGDYINVCRESAPGRIYHRNRMRALSFSVTGASRSVLQKLVSDFPFTGSCHGEVGQ
ncbi:MAG: efflux RND transporter permease subunit [Spirochaetia bacterium]|nr:efflux RND transporter permease subunit [Spirochaetia bacterium]